MEQIEDLRQTYSDVFVIVSPPRCSSTALARIFWEHPAIGHYCHEPFEALYYWGQTLDEVLDRIKKPLDLTPLKRSSNGGIGDGIVIKEMPYQVGKHFELLASLATAPITFLIRDPRLNISSRMRKKEEVGDSPLFPLVESGWKLLKSQIAFCQAAEIPHLVVDSRDFRNRPNSVIGKLFNRLHLSFSADMLEWKPQSSFDIDNLDGKHTHLYERVLKSEGLLVDDDPIPPIESFPEDGGFYEHVQECLNIYGQLREHEQFVSPRDSVRMPFQTVRAGMDDK